MKNGIRLALVAGCMLVPTSSFALEKGFLTEEDLVRPQPIKELQWIEREDKPFGPISTMPMDIRRDAQIEAATSYGARGGLAWQTFSIRQELKQRARYMDKVYDFGQLLIPAPSGLLIEPPIVSESANAMIIEYGAQEAAVSDRIYHIIQNARIVSSPRTWQAYLEREWGRVQPPPDVLRPANGEERDLWIKYVNRGWDEGVRQANEIFQDDLALLTADFEGMVRYRMLLSQGMISPPKALQIDRGVTGGGNEMRVGDRAVQITGVPELITGADEWKPANR
ncbi:MAG: type IV secretion system DotC family protein [Micavibrio sp.]|nr:type IV secretion system DotC family protein [Micavibrio sp.]